MATITRTHRMTAEEFFDDPNVPERAELVDGLVVVRGEASDVTPFPPPIHAWIVYNLYDRLTDWVRPRGLGRVLGDGTPYQLGPGIVRGPDVSFIRADRLPGGPPRRGGWPFAPDLAVEVLSPSDTHAEVRRKLANYFGAGTRLVWLVDPDERGIEVHAPHAAGVWVAETGTLNGGDVLPGFTVLAADVFAGVPRDG